MKIYDYKGRKNISGNRIREARLKKRLSPYFLRLSTAFPVRRHKGGRYSSPNRRDRRLRLRRTRTRS